MEGKGKVWMRKRKGWRSERQTWMEGWREGRLVRGWMGEIKQDGGRGNGGKERKAGSITMTKVLAFVCHPRS